MSPSRHEVKALPATPFPVTLPRCPGINRLQFELKVRLWRDKETLAAGRRGLALRCDLVKVERWGQILSRWKRAMTGLTSGVPVCFIVSRPGVDQLVATQ